MGIKKSDGHVNVTSRVPWSIFAGDLGLADSKEQVQIQDAEQVKL